MLCDRVVNWELLSKLAMSTANPTPILKLSLVIVALHATVCSGYRPVIVMHGILSSATAQRQLVDMIQQAHHGTEVLNVDMFNDLESIFVEMWKQVDGVYNSVLPFMKNSSNGVNLVCFSQGCERERERECVCVCVCVLVCMCCIRCFTTNAVLYAHLSAVSLRTILVCHNVYLQVVCYVEECCRNTGTTCKLLSHSQLL